MNVSDFFMALGKLSASEEYSEFAEHIQDLVSLLDTMDEEDSFGTEGWKHAIGIDD